MSISQLTSEQIQEMAMIEIAYKLLEGDKQAIDFYELFNKVAEIKGLTQEQKDDRIAQFYTDMNVDGSFLCIGENRWGLRNWYPYDQADEEVTMPAKPKKKKGKKKLTEDDFDDYEYDEDFDDEDIDEVDEDVEDEDFDDDDEDFDVSEDEDIIEDEEIIDEDEFELDEEFDDAETDEDIDDEDDDEEYDDDKDMDEEKED